MLRRFTFLVFLVAMAFHMLHFVIRKEDHQNMPLCGGLSELKPATDETQQLANQVKQEAEAKANKTFAKFEAISFKSQLVAGVNYFIKVDVGDGYVHLRVFQPLPHTGQPPELSGIQLNKTLEDQVEYVEQN